MNAPENESMEIPKELTEIYKFVDEHKEKYLEDLRQAISIPSVSCEPFRDRDLILMAEWMAEKLRSIGVTAELWEYQTASIYQPLEFKHISTSCVEVPPIVLGYFGDDPNKKTVMFCGHYDVLPASLNDGWMSDPFKLLRKGERLYGRGVSDNKGPCIIWFNAIEAYLNIHQTLPVNIKIVIDGMDECGFAGFYNLLHLNRTFFENVDYVVISEEQWLTSSTPCLGYSLRGFVCFSVDVECCKKDLHSGTHGGLIYEAMPDLIYLLEGLVGNNGEILIPGFYDDLAPFSLSEEKEISEINFDVNKFKKQIGCERLLHNNKVHLLMALWRYPNLSIHAIDGVCPDSGEKTVIPKKVRGKFSIRLIPFQKSDKIIKLVKEFLDEKWKARHSYNKYELHISSSYRDWVIIPRDNHNYRSAIKATKYVYGVEPQIIRCGGSSLSLIKVHEVSNASMLSLPLSSADDCAHSQNENLEARVYFNGIKLVASYLYELSKDEDDVGSTKTETASRVSTAKRDSKKTKK